MIYYTPNKKTSLPLFKYLPRHSKSVRRIPHNKKKKKKNGWLLDVSNLKNLKAVFKIQPKAK
jgi:hypothetical protein